MPTHIHYRACNLCEAICGLKIEISDGEIRSIKGDEQDPLSRGHICPKAVALKDVYQDPDRLRRPVRRTANGWREISWEEAVREVADRLQRIQDTYGNDAVGVYLGNPNVHNSGSMLAGSTFLRHLRTRNRFSATSADQLPHHFAALFMFGHYFAIPVPDIDRTDFMLILGANPLVSNGSLMTAPGMAHRLRDLQHRGGRFVVIDPRRSETAVKADEHHFIRPGADAFLLLAMIHTLFDEALIAPAHLADLIDGVDEVERHARTFTPERAATVTGISSVVIRRLARDFAAAPAAVAYGRMGLSTQAFGGLCQWLINVLNILTGNFDRPGGAMFTLPAFDLVEQRAAKGKHGAFGRWKSRVRGLPEFGGELPVSELAEEIITPGKGQIKAMLTVAGNPVLSTPNGGRLDEALAELEFMAAIDIYINETTRHAHIILPPTTGLETEHYDLIFDLLAVRNTARYSPATIEKTADQRHDWEIYHALAERFSGEPVNGLTPELMLAMGLQYGPYAKEGLSLERLKASPHGIDLGPLQPCLPDRLFTNDKHIHLAPPQITDDLQRLRNSTNWSAPSDPATLKYEDPPLLLIGRRQLRSNNSWMHNSRRLVKGRERCTLLIHPDDAKQLGINDGATAQVSSKTGSIQLPAEVSDEIMQGVVSIPHGWGHGREGVRMTTAQRHAGASLNDITDHLLVDELTGNAAFSGVPVQVSPAG